MLVEEPVTVTVHVVGEKTVEAQSGSASICVARRAAHPDSALRRAAAALDGAAGPAGPGRLSSSRPYVWPSRTATTRTVAPIDVGTDCVSIALALVAAARRGAARGPEQVRCSRSARQHAEHEQQLERALGRARAAAAAPRGAARAARARRGRGARARRAAADAAQVGLGQQRGCRRAAARGRARARAARARRRAAASGGGGGGGGGRRRRPA